MSTPSPARVTIGTEQFSRATGLEIRQVEYWSEQRILWPEIVSGGGQGRRMRQFTLEDALRVVIVKKLGNYRFRDAVKFANRILAMWSSLERHSQVAMLVGDTQTVVPKGHVKRMAIKRPAIRLCGRSEVLKHSQGKFVQLIPLDEMVSKLEEYFQ
jgi:hypothetical protein